VVISHTMGIHEDENNGASPQVDEEQENAGKKELNLSLEKKQAAAEVSEFKNAAKKSLDEVI
jgi:hypothetical protein